WFTGTYFVKSPELVPLAALLQKYVMELSYSTIQPDKMSYEQMQMMGQSITPEAFKMAVLIITTLPIIIVYPFLQKYFE
ncbi:MAG: carbohydrate ABC transporter permease, partial [Niameybacter sp.]